MRYVSHLQNGLHIEEKNYKWTSGNIMEGVSERWVIDKDIQSGFYFLLSPWSPSGTDISTRRVKAERYYGFQGGSGVGESTPQAKEILKTFCHHANIATLIHLTCTSALNFLQIPLFNMCQPSAFISDIPNNLHINLQMAVFPLTIMNIQNY